MPKNPSSSGEVIFNVEKGQGSKDIAINLKNQGFIKSTTFFRFYVLTVGEAGNLQAGDYTLSQSMSVFQISGKMARGEVIKKNITIIEGWNIRDIAWSFENRECFRQKNFLS